MKEVASLPLTSITRLSFMSATVSCVSVMNEVTMDVPISKRLSSFRSSSLISNVTLVLLLLVTSVPPVSWRALSVRLVGLRCKVMAVISKLVIFTVSSNINVIKPSFMFR